MVICRWLCCCVRIEVFEGAQRSAQHLKCSWVATSSPGSGCVTAVETGKFVTAHIEGMNHDDFPDETDLYHLFIEVNNGTAVFFDDGRAIPDIHHPMYCEGRGCWMSSPGFGGGSGVGF